MTEEVYPKLNTLLLEDLINWAIRAYNGDLEPDEPEHVQSSWYDRVTLKSIARHVEQVAKTVREGRNVYTSPSSERIVQNNYCGSTYCICGRGLVLTGNGYHGKAWNSALHVVKPEEFVPWDSDRTDLTVKAIKSDRDYVTAGALALGLTMSEAGLLFEGCNTVEDLIQYAEHFAARRGEKLNLLDLKK